MKDAGTVITMVLIASFAVDRMTGSLLFVVKALIAKFPEPTESRYKFIYFGLAAAFSVAILFGFDLRALDAMGIHGHPYFDLLVTGIVLVGGAEKISTVLKPADTGSAASIGGASREPTISGKLILEGVEVAISKGQGR